MAASKKKRSAVVRVRGTDGRRTFRAGVAPVIGLVTDYRVCGKVGITTLFPDAVILGSARLVMPEVVPGKCHTLNIVDCTVHRDKLTQ